MDSRLLLGKLGQSDTQLIISNLQNQISLLKEENERLRQIEKEYNRMKISASVHVDTNDDGLENDNIDRNDSTVNDMLHMLSILNTASKEIHSIKLPVAFHQFMCRNENLENSTDKGKVENAGH